jgi:type IV pilus assembly protein PilW
LANVVAAKVYLLVRAPDASAGYTDGKSYTLGSSGVKDAAGSTVAPYSYTPSGAAQKFQRHVYSTTVRLNNVSARRETP